MKKQSSPTDFTVPLEGVGDFVFARPSIKDLMTIDRKYGEMVGLSDHVVRLNLLASMVAIHEVTCVSCPKGWENLEARGSEDDANISNLLIAYRAKEDSFRGGDQAGSQEQSSGTGENT